MTLEEKIKKINKPTKLSKLVPLSTDSAETIAEFWERVVDTPLSKDGLRLPDYDTMKKWHELLIDYVEKMPDPIVFMIRKGNEESKEYMETVPADALRRGFLTKTDADYWFVYNDNDFATYMLAMVLDDDIIHTLTPNELLNYLKTPNSIIRFNKNGKDGVERKRAFYKINGTQPRISQNGYTVAHIFDVNNHYYDESMGFDNIGGEEALKSVGILKGKYSHYVEKEKFQGREIYYRDNYHVGADARKFLIAHMLRFLHPLNYFCAPKDNMNGYVYCEFTDYVNNGKAGTRLFRRISGYEHLLYYAHHKFREKYSDIYIDFLKRIMVPLDEDYNAFAFFEKSYNPEISDFYGSELISAKYGNPLFSSASKTATSSTTISTPTSPRGTGSKKRRMYEIDGQHYNMRNAILTLVKKYINDNPSVEYAELKNTFSVKLSGKSLIRLESELTSSDIKHPNVFSDRITLVDGCVIAINNQAQSKDMNRVLEIAKDIGYSLVEV